MDIHIKADFTYNKLSTFLERQVTQWTGPNFESFRNKVNNKEKHAKETFYNNLELIITDFENKHTWIHIFLICVVKGNIKRQRNT